MLFFKKLKGTLAHLYGVPDVAFLSYSFEASLHSLETSIDEFQALKLKNIRSDLAWS